MSPLRKVRIIRKWKILDDIFIFRTSVMPEHQGVENNGNIAKRAVSRYYDFLKWTQQCYVEYHLPKGKTLIKLYFSTNVERGAKQILKYYQARYQMEFIFRDAKQYTGLAQCQARSEKKLHFHFNASLTSISIGKGIIRKEHSKEKRAPFQYQMLRQNYKTEIWFIEYFQSMVLTQS
ncbi:MAG: hypothetical protein ACJA01_004195 [Saprospiraceae bacterium]|jgi:hypothetical protein